MPPSSRSIDGESCWGDRLNLCIVEGCFIYINTARAQIITVTLQTSLVCNTWLL